MGTYLYRPYINMLRLGRRPDALLPSNHYGFRPEKLHNLARITVRPTSDIQILGKPNRIEN